MCGGSVVRLGVAGDLERFGIPESGGDFLKGFCRGGEERLGVGDFGFEGGASEGEIGAV